MLLTRHKRLTLIFFVIFTSFSILLARLYVIQITKGEHYYTLALKQGSQSVSLEEYERGKILDRNKIPISGERWENRIVVFPSEVTNPVQVANELAVILRVDEKALWNYLTGKPECLPYQVGHEQMVEIKDRDWPGVMVLPVLFRYGERPLAAHTIGHMGKISSINEWKNLAGRSKKIYNFGDFVGKTGLESYFELDLKGQRPERAVRAYNDAKGRMLTGAGIVEEQIPDRDRRHLVLTIDAQIQSIVEDVMDHMVARGAVVVMEAGSGDILAIASRPVYNPDPLKIESEHNEHEREIYYDRSLALYQPGSLFKIVVAAAALEEGLLDMTRKFQCNGRHERLVRCWNHNGHGVIGFTRAFAESCNPVFAEVALELGASKLIDCAERMGLANQSIIGYPVPTDQRQDLYLIAEPFNLVNSSIGQGPVLATPVQITAMINTIVSDGVCREARLVSEVLDYKGNSVNGFSGSHGKRAISPDVARELRELMVKVTESGVGSEASVPVYGSAGKTGSAQMDGTDSLNTWFAGYAPLNKPRFVVTVLVEGGKSGGETAAPVFRCIMERIMKI